MNKNDFKILGITPTNDIKVIKRAYRKKAIQYHPDKNKSSEANKQFIRTTEAYDRIIKGLNFAKNTKRGKQYSFHDFNKVQKQSQEAFFHERLKKAKLRYKYLKRKEAEENERYYKLISEGKSWKSFKWVMYGCLFMSFVFFADNLLLPSRWNKDTINKGSRILSYSGVHYNKIVPISTVNGEKAWIKSTFYGVLEKNPNVYIEKTFFFRDIKNIWIWDRDTWLYSKADFSVTGSFPIVPLFLLVPFITYFIRGRTLTYSLLFNISLYIFGITLIFLLYSNDRWAHIISFGLV